MNMSFLAPERRLGLWGFGFNLVWELAQTPLYADSERDLAYVVWTRVHCTLGDVLILLGAFWLTAAALRSRRWYLDSRVLGPAIFLASGLAYTTWSEWMNTSIRAAWVYRPEMPLILGIGLAPLLQWVLIPPVIVALLRRDDTTGGLAAEKTVP